VPTQKRPSVAIPLEHSNLNDQCILQMTLVEIFRQGGPTTMVGCRRHTMPRPQRGMKITRVAPVACNRGHPQTSESTGATRENVLSDTSLKGCFYLRAAATSSMTRASARAVPVESSAAGVVNFVPFRTTPANFRKPPSTYDTSVSSFRRNCTGPSTELSQQQTDSAVRIRPSLQLPSTVLSNNRTTSEGLTPCPNVSMAVRNFSGGRSGATKTWES
jgi:hypothetical protein